MRLLLDIHIWLWSLVNPDRLSPKISHELENPENEIWLSPISVWELLTLARKGRVILNGEPESWVREALSKVSLKEAWLTHEVVTQSMSLRHPQLGSFRSVSRGHSHCLRPDVGQSR